MQQNHLQSPWLKKVIVSQTNAGERQWFHPPGCAVSFLCLCRLRPDKLPLLEFLSKVIGRCLPIRLIRGFPPQKEQIWAWYIGILAIGANTNELTTGATACRQFFDGICIVRICFEFQIDEIKFKVSNFFRRWLSTASRDFEEEALCPIPEVLFSSNFTLSPILVIALWFALLFTDAWLLIMDQGSPALRCLAQPTMLRRNQLLHNSLGLLIFCRPQMIPLSLRSSETKSSKQPLLPLMVQAYNVTVHTYIGVKIASRNSMGNFFKVALLSLW